MRMRAQNLLITAVKPSLGVPGGEITIQCSGFRPGLPSDSKVAFGPVEAGIVTASEERVIVRLPDSPSALGVTLQLEDQSSPVFPFVLASQLAAGLHPVTSPVISPDGSIFTTISGSRGQQVPRPLIKITRTGEKIQLPCEIMNPTGLAFGPDDQLYISSRHDGTVVRFKDYEEIEVFAEDLGVACGIAFDSRGFLYVGDRSGKIFRIDPAGAKEEHAVLEPSISAYHLCMDSVDRLYVTGPTLSMRDVLYRIPEKGRVEMLLRGLARPQGMAFLSNGDLLIAASFLGKKGIFKFSPQQGDLVHFIAAPMLVGVAVAGNEVVLADTGSIYRIRPQWGSSQVI
jgi:sugar lactone lactonase YvrE